MRYFLRDRNKPLPNGVGCYDSSTGYRAAPFASFTQQVNGVMAARIGNPGLCARYRLPTDYAACEAFVDSYLGKVAFDNGWAEFYVAERGDGTPNVPSPPKPPPPRLPGRIANLVAGAAISVDWIASKKEAVPNELASNRAETCSKCPKNNNNGDWLALFTVKSAEAIKKALEFRLGMKLSTPFDDKIGVCDACDCVCKLKVHMPLKKILGQISDEDKAALDEKCWITNEK